MRNARPNTRSAHANVFVRCMAAFLVLFACADICFPQIFCGGGGANASTTPALLSSEPARGDAVTEETFVLPDLDDRNAKSRRQDESPEQDSQEEDCFCCCAHVVPADAFSVAAGLNPLAITFAARYASPLSPPFRSLYRPPRSA